MLKVILIGKSGNGKSSTGNRLLGYNGFKVNKSLNAVTEKCEMKTGFLGKRGIRVVDTPGLFDTGSSLIKRAIEIQKAVNICPNPNVFLLVFSSANRFTKEELFTVDLMRVMFGEKIFQHVSIVFTRGGDFQDADVFKKFWEDNKFLKDLAKRCDGRIFKIENSTSHNEDLLEFINTIKDSSVYKYRYLDSHKATLEEYLKKCSSDSQNIKQQIEDLVKILGTKLSSKIWNSKFIAGVALLTLVSGSFGIAAPMAATMIDIEVSTIQTSVLTMVVGSALGYMRRYWWGHKK